MLTPQFSVTQSDDDIVLVIRAPLANIRDTELSVVDEQVVFYSSPYYLRLHLPGKVVEIEGDTGKYSCDTQEFSFVLKKSNPGEYFKDLDLIGKLLIPTTKHKIKPEIAICNEEVVPSSDPESDEESLGYIKQEIVSDRGHDLPRYGFANKGQGISQQLRYEFKEILDFVDFENTVHDDRSLMREADELSKFSEDHYLADLMDSDEIDMLLDWSPKLPVSPNEVKFTQEEKDRLKALGNRDYLLSSDERNIALCSLVDILFAYAYDQRTTFGEESVESPWTINKLSATLSWLQSFNSMEEVKISCIRRALIFPLYRHWELIMNVLEDTLNIIKLGRRQILKCFLHIHKMFANSEPRYLLNQLYITDYCIWIQKISENKIKALENLFEQTLVTKSDVRLELVELENAAFMVKEEELNIVNKLMGMTLSESDHDKSDSDSDESEDSESSSSSSISSESSDDITLDSDDISSDDD